MILDPFAFVTVAFRPNKSQHSPDSNFVLFNIVRVTNLEISIASMTSLLFLDPSNWQIVVVCSMQDPNKFESLDIVPPSQG